MPVEIVTEETTTVETTESASEETADAENWCYRKYHGQKYSRTFQAKGSAVFYIVSKDQNIFHWSGYVSTELCSA